MIDWNQINWSLHQISVTLPLLTTYSLWSYFEPYSHIMPACLAITAAMVTDTLIVRLPSRFGNYGHQFLVVFAYCVLVWLPHLSDGFVTSGPANGGETFFEVFLKHLGCVWIVEMVLQLTAVCLGKLARWCCQNYDFDKYMNEQFGTTDDIPLRRISRVAATRAAPCKSLVVCVEAQLSGRAPSGTAAAAAGDPPSYSASSRAASKPSVICVEGDLSTKL